MNSGVWGEVCWLYWPHPGHSGDEDEDEDEDQDEDEDKGEGEGEDELPEHLSPALW